MIPSVFKALIIKFTLPAKAPTSVSNSVTVGVELLVSVFPEKPELELCNSSSNKVILNF